MKTKYNLYNYQYYRYAKLPEVTFALTATRYHFVSRSFLSMTEQLLGGIHDPKGIHLD